MRDPCHAQPVNQSIDLQLTYSIDIGAVANEKASGFEGSGAGSVVKSAPILLQYGTGMTNVVDVSQLDVQSPWRLC